MKYLQTSAFRRIPHQLGVFLFSWLSLLCLLSPASAEQLIKVGVYENPPKIYKDELGDVSGFWPELLAEIAKEENWTLDYVHGTWNEGLTRLAQAEIDIMPIV